MTPKRSYYRNPWIHTSNLLGGISIEQVKSETQSKAGFLRLLQSNYTSEELNASLMGTVHMVLGDSPTSDHMARIREVQRHLHGKSMNDHGLPHTSQRHR